MPTLVLPPRYTSDTARLWKAALAAGWKTERLLSLRASLCLQDRTVALYGEPFFAAVVAEQLNLALLEPALDWLVQLPHGYRQRDVEFTTLQDARKESRRAFIKPADDKSFPARIYESGQDLPPTDALPDSTPVLVSEPVQWESEFRCFVLQGNIVTLSVYMRDGSLAQAEDDSWPASSAEIKQAAQFAADVVAKSGVAVPPSVVIDVGIIAGRGWAVVEANPSWGSGLYSCDPAEVLKVVARACVPREKLTVEDQLWLITRQGQCD